MANTTTSIVQVIVGATLILTGMSVNATPLGGLALLPLIGTIPLFFGIFGVQSPVCKLISKAVTAVQRQADKIIPENQQIA